MTNDLDVTDLFAGAGGSSTGAIQVPGVTVRIAANHWKVACDIHAANHQHTDHAIVDLHQERPSFFPKTAMLWASPECTKWSQANGAKMPSIEEGLFEDPLSDEAKTRSRLLMFDVLRFIEYHRYRLVIVENVVDIATQAKYRTAWTIWRQELRALGYQFRVVSLNSMHAQTFGMPAPQSRDRIYIVAWPEGEKAPEIDRILRPKAYCDHCDTLTESVQSFKRGRTVGRYRQSYLYCCPRCGQVVEPGWLPAAAAIDWSIPGERVGDRLKPKTRYRIAAGIARYWSPLVLEAAGNTYDAADPAHPHYGELDAYYRAWPAIEALRALHTTSSKAIATPLIVNHVSGADASRTREVTEALPSLVASGLHASLLVPVEGRDGKDAQAAGVPMRTQTTRAETALVTPFLAEMYGTSTARSVMEPAGTFTAGGNHHALIHRHNGGGAEMTTPATESLRTLTTGGNVSLLQRPERREITASNLKTAMEMVPEVLFRMLRPHEIAAGMAFPSDYNWQPPERTKPVSNRDLVKAAGNAVTPPAARDLVAVGAQSLGLELPA